MDKPGICCSPNADISTRHAAQYILRVRRERWLRYHVVSDVCIFASSSHW